MNQKDRCLTCRILGAMPCPILDIAVRLGFEGMAFCEMADCIDRLIEDDREGQILAGAATKRARA